MADRHQRERSAWVISHARGRGSHRRGEKLAQAARRAGRDAAGVGDSAYAETLTPNLLHRHVMREEGVANVVGWLALTLAWMFWAAVLLGPGLALGWALYGLCWALVPRLGRVRVWPFLVAALVVAGASWIAWRVWAPHGWGWRLLVGWVVVQLVVGPLWAARLTRANGWSVVARTPRTGAKPTQKIALDHMADVEVDEAFRVDQPVMDVRHLMSDTESTGSDDPLDQFVETHIENGAEHEFF